MLMKEDKECLDFERQKGKHSWDMANLHERLSVRPHTGRGVDLALPGRHRAGCGRLECFTLRAVPDSPRSRTPGSGALNSFVTDVEFQPHV